VDDFRKFIAEDRVIAQRIVDDLCVEAQETWVIRPDQRGEDDAAQTAPA
jgi:hypothetical protein